MTSKNLFGEEITPKNKSHFYNKYDLISWLLKSMRLGDKETAIKVFWLMKCEGVSEFYIAKKLVQFASEDSVGAEAFNYAFNAFQLIKEIKSEENTLQRVILYLCRSEKMWESEEEHKWEVKRIHIREKTKRDYKEGRKPLEVPEWVYDIYTAKGKAKKRNGEQIDERFSGVLRGSGFFCRASYLWFGRLSTSATDKKQVYSKHLEKCKAEGLTVDEYLGKYGITVAEFLKS